MTITKTIRNATIAGLAALTMACDVTQEPAHGVMLPAEGICYQVDTLGKDNPRTYIIETNGATGRYFAGAEAFKKPIMTIETNLWTSETPSTTTIIAAPAGSRLHNFTEVDLEKLRVTAADYASQGKGLTDCSKAYRTI